MCRDEGEEVGTIFVTCSCRVHSLLIIKSAHVQVSSLRRMITVA